MSKTVTIDGEEWTVLGEWSYGSRRLARLIDGQLRICHEYEDHKRRGCHHTSIGASSLTALETKALTRLLAPKEIADAMRAVVAQSSRRCLACGHGHKYCDCTDKDILEAIDNE